MERFIRLNRSILDCDLTKGGWRLDEEGIAAIEDEVAGLPLARMGGPDPARPMEEPARGRRPPRPRPPLRRPLPRGPDGDALGRCMIFRFVGPSVRLRVCLIHMVI